MKFLCLMVFAAITAPFALAADANTILNDVSAINSTLQVLTRDVQALVPGLAGLSTALQIQVDTVTVDKQTNNATADANALPNRLSFNDSLNIGLKLMALQPQIASSLNNVTAMNTTFGDFRPIVLASLYQLKQDTDAFAKALTNKLDFFVALLAPFVTSQIDSSFNKAIVVFGGKAT